MTDKILGLLLCLVLSIIYVVPFYIWRSPHVRDHPYTIKRRFGTALLSCILGTILVWTYLRPTEASAFNQILGLAPSALVLGWITPLITTSILFLGPISCDTSDGDSSSRYDSPIWGDWKAWRDLLIAPILEEWMFRGLLLPVLLQAGFSRGFAILIAPLFFGIAHLHHFYDLVHHQQFPASHALIKVGVQFLYTCFFGWIAAQFFVSEKSLSAAMVPHCFCNIMGIPDISGISKHKHPKRVYTNYMVGIVGFFAVMYSRVLRT